MERERTNGERARGADVAGARGVDWGYLVTHMLMFPPLLMVGICSRLAASSRTGVADDGRRPHSIFRGAAEDARNAISIAMTDI